MPAKELPGTATQSMNPPDRVNHPALRKRVRAGHVCSDYLNQEWAGKALTRLTKWRLRGSLLLKSHAQINDAAASKICNGKLVSVLRILQEMKNPCKLLMRPHQQFVGAIRKSFSMVQPLRCAGSGVETKVHWRRSFRQSERNVMVSPCALARQPRSIRQSASARWAPQPSTFSAAASTPSP